MRRRNNNRQSIGDNNINNPGTGVRTQQGIGQKNMSLLNLELFSFETRDIVTNYDENQKVVGQSVQSNKGTVSYGVATGEVRVDNPDGSGFSVIVNPLITDTIVGWIKSNIKKAEEQDKITCQQRDEEHKEQMKRLEAQTKEAELHLEEARLQHEIRMVELQIELVEKRKDLRETEAETEKETKEEEPA